MSSGSPSIPSRPAAGAALLLTLAIPATAVAPDHQELERQVEALMTLHEAALLLEEAASREGSYPDLPDWESLVERLLAPEGLVGVSRTDPWGAPYLYQVTGEGDRYLIASPGADGDFEGGRAALREMLLADRPPPPALSDAPGTDLLFLGARASWCPQRCGFLRAPEWAGREWGGSLSWVPPPPAASAGPALESPSRCLAGEAAATWLTLRTDPTPRSAERGRLTAGHDPLRRTGAVRLRRTELWVQVDTSLGEGWVRARFLGPCREGDLPPIGPAETFEIDRLLGPVALALAEGDGEALAALVAPAGVRLLPGGGRPLPAGELLVVLAGREGLPERIASASWTLEEHERPAGADAATPVRDRATGLTLWFARSDGRPGLAALSPGGPPPRALQEEEAADAR